MVDKLQKIYFEELKIVNMIKENNHYAVSAFDKLLTRFQEEHEKDPRKQESAVWAGNRSAGGRG